MRAQRLEFMGQAAQVGEVQDTVLAAQLQHFQAAACAVLLVLLEGAEAVHVDEAVHRFPALPQLAQGADTQAAEGRDAARTQHAARLAQHRRQIRAPLDRQAGKQQVAGRVAQRQPFGIATDEVQRTTLLASVAQHALGDIDGQALCLGITRRQGAGEIAGAATQVDPALRRSLCRQQLQQAAADSALQVGHCVVGRRGAGKGGGYLPFIGQRAGTAIRHLRPRG